MRIIVATITFLFLDAIWLGLIAKEMYVEAFGSIMRMSNGNIQPFWPAALFVYALIIVGILVFAIPKANNQPLQALFWGALFGLVTYAVYDFTNLAVLSTWSLKISIIDTLWGITICGLTSMITVLVCNFFQSN